MTPLLWLAGTAIAGWAGWKWLASKETKPGYAGNFAKVGDKVQVAPNFLQTTEIIPWPSGRKPLWVEIEVLGADDERVQGPITGLDYMPGVPMKVGNFVVKRSAIYKVARNGKIVAETSAATTSMHGEG